MLFHYSFQPILPPRKLLHTCKLQGGEKTHKHCRVLAVLLYYNRVGSVKLGNLGNLVHLRKKTISPFIFTVWKAIRDVIFKKSFLNTM